MRGHAQTGIDDAGRSDGVRKFSSGAGARGTNAKVGIYERPASEDTTSAYTTARWDYEFLLQYDVLLMPRRCRLQQHVQFERLRAERGVQYGQRRMQLSA